MTNEELLVEMKTAATNLSYYNAAEGEMWSQERPGRWKAQQAWDDLVLRAKGRGIWNPEDWRGYLVNRG